MGSLIPRSFLFRGSGLEVLRGVIVKHPTVGEILDLHGGLMCEDYYWAYVSTLLSDPYDHMVYLDDQGIDYETVTAFEVFMLRWNSAVLARAKENARGQSGTVPTTLFEEALSFFFGAEREYTWTQIQDQLIIVDGKDPNWLLTKDAFLLAVDFIRNINCVRVEDHIKPANAFAKKVLIEDARIEQRKPRWRKQDEERPEQIADAIATVLAGGSGSISSQSILDLPIYSLLTTARSVQQQMMVQALMGGMYSGMIKSDKITDKDLRWV